MEKHCYNCGKIFEESELKIVNGDYYCQDCYDEQTAVCECCGERRDIDELEGVHVDAFGGISYYCPNCIEDLAVPCEDCGEVWLQDLCVLDTHEHCICPSCIDEGIHSYCEDCGDLIYTEDGRCVEDHFYCDDCAPEHEIICGYHEGERPLLWHMTDGEKGGWESQKRINHLFVGVELEIDQGGCENQKVIDILAAASLKPNQDIICEYDGSLSNGFELISSTATIPYHLTEYGWERIMLKASQLGYVSHDSGTCGLHVHLDRRYFINNMDNPEELFTILITNNIDWLKKFSRRRDFTYCQFLYAQRFSAEDFKLIPFSNGIKKNVKRSLRQADQALQELRNDYRGHYKALNFNGYNTIEIRFNRGTLRFSTFRATLQLVQMLADVVKGGRRESIVNVNLRTFKKLAQKRNYIEFLNYINERRIK